MIGSTASTSTHRSVASPCIVSTKLRSPHTSWRPACVHPAPQVQVRPPECVTVSFSKEFRFRASWCGAQLWRCWLRDVGCHRRVWNLARADPSDESRTPVFSLAPVCWARSRRRWHIIILGVRLIILRVSGAVCGPILMSHMWPVKKDPSDLPIRLITTQYILMSRVRSYTYNIHIHSTHAGIYICV